MMSYKTLITNSYGDEVYNSTKELQQLKRKSAITKNRWIFLNRCLFHHIVPKSFKTRSTLNTRKGWNITKQYIRQIMIAIRNSEKEKYIKFLRKISVVESGLRKAMRQPDFDDLAQITNKSKSRLLSRNANV